MDRIRELEESIKEHWIERTEKKKDFLMEHYEALKSEFHINLNDLIDDQKNRKREGEQKKIQSIYLNQLLTSVYTESYEVVLGIANSDLYLD